MSDELPDNVIQFRKPKKPGPTPLKITLDKDNAQDMVLALACINIASDFKPECQETFSVNNFPCKENCVCYIHMLSSMAMEVIFDGPKAKEAHEAIMLEYIHMSEKPEDESAVSEKDDDDN